MGTGTQYGVICARSASCAVLLLLVLASDPAHAQSTWNGGTSNYSTAGNWTPATAPTAAGQSAVFDVSGSTTVNVSSPIAPDSWTFNTNTQSYTIGGAAVNFSRAGASGGIIDNASGQTIAINNVIGGTGVQVQVLAGSALILTGPNTYTGGTTVSNGALLQIQNNTALGNGPLTLASGTLQAGVAGLSVANNILVTPGSGGIDNAGFRLTLTGQIKDSGGAAHLTFSDSSFGNGTTILTNTNTYTGGTLICDCTTVQLGTATAKASLVGDLDNEGSFNVVNADTSKITKITNDASGFGPGLTKFLNATTASSINIINRFGGETDFGLSLGTDTASAGSAVITNQTSGSTVFNAFTTAGNANITNKSTGGTSFFDNSSAGSATIVNQSRGLTRFFDSASGGNANITILAGGAVVFATSGAAGNATITNSSNGSFFGFPGGLAFAQTAAAGTATIINNNGGITGFGQSGFTDTVSADHANITNNSGGETDFNARSTAANATITTNSGGKTFFFDNSTGANAQFITNGTGFADFGEGTGPSGDNKISAGSISGSGIYYIGANHTLTVGGNNLSTEVSGVIMDFNPCICAPGGPGTLIKIGTGNLILSGINTYSGPTIVNSGILSVNGSITSSNGVTVNAGGALGGNGQLPSVTIDGGVLAPGNSIGTIAVNGSLTITAASTYLVEVSATAADRTSVTGTATLAGTVATVLQGAPNFGKVYTLLSAAGGRTGTFAAITSSSPLVIAALSYTSTDLQLSLRPNLLPFAGITINQRSVAAGLQNGLTGRGSGAFGGLFTLAPAALPAALTQLTGELGTGLANASLLDMDQFLRLMLDPFVDGRGTGAAALGFAPERRTGNDGFKQLLAFDRMATKAPKLDAYAPRWTVWGGAYGATGFLRGEGSVIGSHDITARNAGFAAGVDYLLSPDTIAGVALTGSNVAYGIAAGLGSGNGDTIKGGAYVSQRIGNAFISTSLAVGRTDARTDRFAIAGGVVDHHTANPTGTSIGGRVEAGYRAGSWFGVAFVPYAALQAQNFRTDAYGETDVTGLSAFALNYNAISQSQVRSEIGGRFDFGTVMIGAATLSWRARAAWAHDYSSAPSIGAAFQALPGSNFAVIGAQRARDAALLSIGPEMSFSKGWSLRAKFDGEFADNSQVYGGTGTLRYNW